MLFGKKKSFIIDWWVAKQNDMFKFVDITDSRNLTEDTRVFGRIDTPTPEYIMNQNAVVKVSRIGIHTASGRFYSFKKAHPLYVLFLREIHVPTDAIIASKWECIDPVKKEYMANLEYPSGKTENNVIFDFEPISVMDLKFVGISDSLADVVVFNTFDWQEISAGKVTAWCIPAPVYQYALELKPLRRKAIRDVRKLLKKK